MDELVSVVVPVYNVAGFLDDCLDSLVAQTHRELQIVLVDDGSTDGSGARCDEWAARDPRVEVVHRSNGGLSAARNSGIDRAKGAWVTFVDSDDVVAPEFVEHLLLIAISQLAEIAITDHVSFSEGGPDYRVSARTPQRTSGVNGLISVIAVRARWSAWGKIFKRTLFDHGVRFQEGILYEDLEFTPRIFVRASAIASTDAALYGYRQREGSIMSTTGKAMSPDLIAVLRSNVAHAIQTFGAESPTTRTLVDAYVLHASKTVESMQDPGMRRRSRAFLDAYRLFISENLAALRKNGSVGVLYYAALVVSARFPGTLAPMFTVARLLKRRALRGLQRRRSNVTSAMKSA